MGVSKSVEVLFHGIEAFVVLTLIVLNVSPVFALIVPYWTHIRVQ